MAKLKITLTKTWEKEIDGEELAEILEQQQVERHTTEVDDIRAAVETDLLSDPTVMLDMDFLPENWKIEVLDPSNSNAEVDPTAPSTEADT